MKALVITCATVCALFAFAPAASATAAPNEPTAIERLVRQEDARRNDLQLGLTRSTPAVLVPPAPRIEVVARDGFDWLDAALGGAAGLAALTAAAAATMVLRSRLPRHA